MLVTMLTSMGLNIVMADPYGSSMLGARIFKKPYEQKRIKPVVLSVAMGDSGTALSHIIPWNLIGALLAGTLGLAATAWAPYAFMAYLTPLVAFVVFFVYKGRLSRPEGAPEITDKEVDQPSEAAMDLA